MKLCDLRPGERFRLAGILQIPGKLVSLTPGAAVVEIEEKAEGNTPRKSRYTWSRETLVEREVSS